MQDEFTRDDTLVNTRVHNTVASRATRWRLPFNTGDVDRFVKMQRATCGLRRRLIETRLTHHTFDTEGDRFRSASCKKINTNA